MLTFRWATSGAAAGSLFVYDVANRRLLLTEQRGDWLPFGDSVLTRIEPDASPSPSPSP